MKKIIRFFMALLLLPFCYAVVRILMTLAIAFKQVPEGSFYFLAGCGGYIAFQWVFFRPIRTYVFGHELTHATAAWLTGGDVKNFHVSKGGGAVTVTKSNTFVALAPYFVPLYALMLLSLYFGVSLFYDLHRYWNIFLALLGMTVGFHAALTLYALRQDQPDLKTAGVFLSSILIFLGNAFILIFITGVLFPKAVPWPHVARVTGRETLQAYERLGYEGYQLWSFAEERIHGSPNRD